jgi:hypothetical protein
MLKYISLSISDYTRPGPEGLAGEKGQKGEGKIKNGKNL